MGNKIAKLRHDVRLSQSALAEVSGVTLRQIQRYEKDDYDRSGITLKNAIALATALNCTVYDLLED